MATRVDVETDSGNCECRSNVTGKELITTFGTLYVECNMESAFRIEETDVNGIEVRSLGRRRERLVYNEAQSDECATYSTSNQLGVITVERGSIDL